MKSVKLLVCAIIFSAICFISHFSFAAAETTKLLYQDITINRDGSITVKEAAWLQGEYNGRLRDIDFANHYSSRFTGIYSNFSGDTDIYNGSSIKDIKIYDISQSNFDSISDIDKSETIYEQVNSAKNGKYGVYTIDQNNYGADFKIFCPSTNNKVFCMEYTITDAVVVHNDVAELYWNVLGDYYEENITDFQVLVHLPGEDDDVRIWTHGPLTGENKIIDSKTLSFKDYNVPYYTPETIRIMFDKSLVPSATKKSNVDGRENILKVESALADEANRTRELAKLNLENRANEAVYKLEENLTIYYYNMALEYVNELDNSNENKQIFLDRINKTKEQVNSNWKEELDEDLHFLTVDNYTYLTRYSLESFVEDVEEGFDEDAKATYLAFVPDLENTLAQKEAGIRAFFIKIAIALLAIILLIDVYVLRKQYIQKHTFKEKYYRDFPSDDNPNVIEYLVKGKSTNDGFSATILNLITKKVLEYEKDSKKDDISLILKDSNYVGTPAEVTVLNLLFNMVGSDNKCSLAKLKRYGANSSIKAKALLKKIQAFKTTTKTEAEEKQYFKKSSFSHTCILIIILLSIAACVISPGVVYGRIMPWFLLYIGFIVSFAIVSIVISSKYKPRTQLGMEKYSKWLAHKRFLEDFSNFDEKDLPEITLWEKYLVTAMVLGCADKVEKRMKLYITNTNDTTIDSNLLIYSSISNNLIRDLSSSVNSATSSATTEISSSSSYSSGGGFGGGSSGGGGRRWHEAAEVVAFRSVAPVILIRKHYFRISITKLAFLIMV